MLEHYVPNFSIGSILFQMMVSQQIRAQDSTGVAIFNREINGDTSYKLNYFMETLDGYKLEEKKTTSEKLGKLLVDLKQQQEPKVVIISSAREMKLVKDVGLVRDLDSRYKITSMKGSHGIGHLRIATSSRVTPYNSHPFSTTVIPDIAVVHNGEITNYWKLRNELELQGYPFYSNCDSEVIAVFIADQILKHGNIERAHYQFIKKADGPFTYLLATDESLALVRDKFGARKGIFGYNPGGDKYPPFWAMATDLSALDVVGASMCVEESQPGKPIIFYKP
jgi:glutamine phosphoribosylpyrophosphate amidotransferase